MEAHQIDASDREAAAASAPRRPICKNDDDDDDDDDDDGRDVDASSCSLALLLVLLLVLARGTRLLVEGDEEIDALRAFTEP